MKKLVVILGLLAGHNALAARADGSLVMTNTGSLKVIWDNIEIEGGQVGSNGAVLPTLAIDLGQVVDAGTLHAIQIEFAPGSYNTDPVRGSTDVKVGTVSIVFNQYVLGNKNWDLTLSEDASVTPYFHRKFLATGSDYSGTPFSISISSQLVRHFGNGMAVSLGFGVFGAVTRSMADGSFSEKQGEDATAEISLGRFAFGVSAEEDQTEIPGVGTFHDHNEEAYIRYTLHKNSDWEDSITFSVGDFEDESIPMADGRPHSGLTFGLQYSIKF